MVYQKHLVWTFPKVSHVIPNHILHWEFCHYICDKNRIDDKSKSMWNLNVTHFWSRHKCEHKLVMARHWSVKYFMYNQLVVSKRSWDIKHLNISSHLVHPSIPSHCGATISVRFVYIIYTNFPKYLVDNSSSVWVSYMSHTCTR